jgi:glycosyltransferase involved in cell wall biosynthesis
VHELDLISYVKEGEQFDPEVRALFRAVTLVPSPPDKHSPIFQRISKAVSAHDFVRTSDEMRNAIEAALHTNRYSLAFDAGGYVSPNLPSEPLSVPLIIDAVDEPLVRELRAMRVAHITKKLGHVTKIWRNWLFEKSAFGRGEVVIFASEVDAAFYKRCFRGRRVAVIPNGVDATHYAPSGLDSEYGLVVFEGNMHFGPNADTARRLALEILPRLVVQVPEARVAIVGRDPDPSVRGLASDRVLVTGTVDDVRPYLERASVFACPMKLGSGIKNKILQAWAMARPVVASSESLGGLDARDGENILVRDDPDSFADAVAALMRDPVLAKSIASAGRDTAVQEYSWNARANELDELFSRTVNQR